jgi:hypothetical protein
MPRTADVRSLEAMRQFLRELRRYRQSLQQVLEGLQVQSHKAVDWVEHDRARHWPLAAKRAEDRLAAARNQLLRCKTAALEGQRKSCSDEKQAVERAVSRLRHCQAQVKSVRHWRQKLRQRTDEFSGKLARLAHYVEEDLPQAIAALERMLGALEKYVQVPPQAADAAPPASPTASDTGGAANPRTESGSSD